MREIKFRCWDNEANVMLSDISDGMMIQMNSGKVGWYDDHGDFEEKNYPLMQFTGLKDKDGKEIYEGDILKGMKRYACKPHWTNLEHKAKIDEAFNKQWAENKEFIGAVAYDRGILECANTLSSVKASFNSFNTYTTGEGIGSSWQEEIINFEIIGDIHQNPELK